MGSKRPNQADTIYREHLSGGRFAGNPANNRQALIERMYQRILGELATNRFEWKGMPESIDLRFLEITLYYFGVSIFYFDKDFDKFFALQGGPAGEVNMMQNPTAFQVVGNRFVGKRLTDKQAIPIWANYMRMPDLDIVTVYSSRLAELDRTIEINSKNARRSKIVGTTENKRLSMVNIQRQIDEGQPIVQVVGAMEDIGNVAALDLGVNPDTILNLHILRTRMWSECMGMLGIENANQDKKERLVSAEVDANNDQTNSMRYVNLNARREAIENIKRIYPNAKEWNNGEGPTVEYRTDTDRAAQEIPDPMTADNVPNPTGQDAF